MSETTHVYDWRATRAGNATMFPMLRFRWKCGVLQQAFSGDPQRCDDRVTWLNVPHAPDDAPDVE